MKNMNNWFPPNKTIFHNQYTNESFMLWFIYLKKLEYKTADFSVSYKIPLSIPLLIMCWDQEMGLILIIIYIQAEIIGVPSSYWPSVSIWRNALSTILMIGRTDIWLMGEFRRWALSGFAWIYISSSKRHVPTASWTGASS